MLLDSGTIVIRHATVVVSITVNWALDPLDWEAKELAIQTSLQKDGFGQTQVESERGELMFGAEGPPLTQIPAVIRPSSSISSRNPGVGSHGTVGVILEIIKVKDSKMVAKVILTNCDIAWAICWQTT